MRDAVFRSDVRVETLLSSVRGEHLKFEDLVEEVGTASWIKRCRGEGGSLDRVGVVVWRVYLLYCTHSVRFVEIEE